MANPEAPILIAPKAPPLSRQGTAESPRRRRPSARAWAAAGALVVLGAVAAYVFLLLPARVDAPTATLSPVPEARRPAPVGTDDSAPPFQALVERQARERAEEHLVRFAATQLRLEQTMNVAAWGTDGLAAAEARAADADLLFQDGNYAAAEGEYQGAVADLEALLAEGDALFEEALEAGSAALAARDHAAANEAFAQALAVRPQAAAAQAGKARAERLPAIAELLREAERATLRGDHDAARELLQQASELDPATAGIDGLLAANQAARAAAQRQAALSDGFAALERGDIPAALAVFDGILARRPDDAAALAGRQQAEQARTLATIERLRTAATEAAAAEQWQAALAACDDALAIDPSLQFAQAGKAQATKRLALLAAMADIVADPAALSADDVFAAAQETAQEAEREAPHGTEFAARLAKLQGVLQAAANPVPLTLMSDNATEVTIQMVGAVGTFERTELALRPGRYVIVGSRDGCRDVRKEILLTRDMPPVDIRCAEAI